MQRADNGGVHHIGRLVRSDSIPAIVVTFGVIASAAADWTQGAAPVSRVSGVSGFVPFLVSALLCLGAAIASTDGRRSPRWRLVSLAAALVAAALADPSYATLLAAVPLIEIARRAPHRERVVTIAGAGALLAWLVITEPTAQQRAGFESMLVLAIVMTIVVMFGDALRRIDRSRVLEARLARVDERSQLADDIHDSVGHNLLAASIQLRTAHALIEHDRSAAVASLDLASGAVAEALADTRLMVDGTRAEGSAFSLERSLSGLVERISTPDVPVSLDVTGDHRLLDTAEQIALYRFTQEALANVVRHANASSVSVDSTIADGHVTVTVADDGRGFDADVAPERTGLAGLRERLGRIGGEVRVASEHGVGTTVSATLEVSS